MRHRSKKKEAEYVVRRELVARLLRQHAKCIGCNIFATLDGRRVYLQRPTQDVHELLPRGRGGSILDEENLICLCRPCHARVTDDPLEGEFCGLTLPSWTQDDTRQEATYRRNALVSGFVPDTLPSWWDQTKRDRWLSRTSDADPYDA